MADPGLFISCWLETRTGTLYRMLDMLPEDIDRVARSLDQGMDTITVVNISGVVMIFPRRILAKVGSGDRCFWEASCTKLNPPGEDPKE